MASRALFPCTCTEAAQTLIESDLNELDPGERARLEAHLSECPACRGQARFLERVRAELEIKPIQDLVPPPRVPSSLADAVQARRFLVRPRQASVRRPALRLALGAAAVAAFVLAAPRLLTDGKPDTAEPASPAGTARPDSHLVQATPKMLDSLTSIAGRGGDSLVAPSTSRDRETGDSI